jgi:bacteriocin biosynthesis cyclodehydratase domain-containing protein
LTSEFQIQVATVNHWTRPSSAEVDLTVMVSDAAEADRLVTEDLVRADQPHLIVRSAGDFVTVGPLVIPGRTACLRCTDLTRRDADRAWPALLDQLTRLRLPAPAALSAWAACMTVTQALAFLRGGTPEAVGSTLELSQHDLVTRRRTWAMHPNCDCHWLSAGQWSA